jgi:hypothetical protein
MLILPWQAAQMARWILLVILAGLDDAIPAGISLREGAVCQVDPVFLVLDELRRCGLYARCFAGVNQNRGRPYPNSDFEPRAGLLSRVGDCRKPFWSSHDNVEPMSFAGVMALPAERMLFTAAKVKAP